MSAGYVIDGSFRSLYRKVSFSIPASFWSGTPRSIKRLMLTGACTRNASGLNPAGKGNAVVTA
jgi:hypothetical protein